MSSTLRERRSLGHILTQEEIYEWRILREIPGTRLTVALETKIRDGEEGSHAE